jgi:hypothetical protein
MLRVANGGVALMSHMSLDGGFLDASGTGECVVGRSTALAQAGAVVVDGGARIAGFGAIGGDASAGIIDDGTIAASRGVLVLESAVSGAGTITIAAGASLLAVKSLAARDVVFETGGPARLIIDPAANVTSTLSGFGAGDTIDLRGLDVASVTFSRGTLTLENGDGVAIGSMHFLGSYTKANFALSPDTASGTSIAFAATPAVLAEANSRMLEDFMPSRSASGLAATMTEGKAQGYGSMGLAVSTSLSGNEAYPVLLHHAVPDSLVSVR